MSRTLDPTQDVQGSEAHKAPKATEAPRRYKVIAVAEFIGYTPAHERYETATGEGSSPRTAATDALDRVLKSAKAKRTRKKFPMKVSFSEG